MIERFRIVHALRIRGVVAEQDLADVTGAAPADVSPVVAELVADELAKVRTGRVGGYSLTPAGRETHAQLLAADVADLAVTAGLDATYQAFVAVNDRFKELCTRWQMRPGPDGPEPNDHSDGAYDAAVVEELVVLHAEAVAALEPGAAASARFGRYPARLAAALERVRAGEHAAFARPMARSYHDVWMEIHQDLLMSLRRERGAADGH